MRYVLLLWVLFSPVSMAAIELYTFDTPQQEALYKELIAELRCLVCQNQNLADSDAELAQDLRKKTYEMVTAGSSREEIVDFMVLRYGDFVLYKPPIQSNTLLLWLGPLLFLLLGIAIVFAVLRGKKREPVKALSDAEREQAQQLLKDK